MSFNNAHIILGKIDKKTQPGRVRERAESEPCLPTGLPKTAVLRREGRRLAPLEFTRQQLKEAAEEVDTSDIQELTPIPTRMDSPPTSPRSAISLKSIVRSLSIGSRPSQITRSWANVQSFEIMRAIEEKDIMFLMEARDKAFPLLLQSSGGSTPLVHAIRTGNKEVAIVLLGAFSRWVNYLDDADIQRPQTQAQLKALRVGLKLAINEGLAKSQSDLVASFMQTLVMSEGDKWVLSQVAAVCRELGAGPSGKPVEAADSAVRRFATRELGKADMIASFEDYVSNATADLLMMGAWANVMESINAEPIPSYYFARDDRVYKAFVDRLDQHRSAIQQSCSKRLRWQLGILKNRFEGRNISYRRKIELVVTDLQGTPS